MGQRGPVGKRDDERVRRNKPEVETDKVSAIGVVEVPDLNLGVVHPLVSDLYESMKDSAQSRFYEPSDWAHARLTLHVLNDLLLDPRGIGAMKLTAVNQMLTSLLLTEGDRRRARIEIERNQSGVTAEVVQISDLFREQLTKRTQT